LVLEFFGRTEVRSSIVSKVSQDKAFIFRVTHIDNVPWLLENGVHCRNSDRRDPNFRQIGNPELIDRRMRRAVPVPPGGSLSDYVPFYFTPHSPMLLNIKTGHNGMKQTPMRDIVILVSSLHRLVEHGVPFVFTDRHAYLRTAQFTGDLADLRLIDWEILAAHDFKRDPGDPGKIERYQAEALVYRLVPVSTLLGIACYNQQAEAAVAGLLKSADVSLKTAVRAHWYFE
jgi:hypothetical protein